ncbi:trehalase-like, partial [Anoplophora glabripennis]|uniref:trehalase-like n=1 Tax=Anoplophora glabripennis TaxID=217634 RepID=UPI000C77E0EE
LLVMIKLCAAQHKQSCNNPIYCQGDVLHVVQTAKIFNDSKTFVDMALVNPINETLANFYAMMSETDNNPSREKIQEYVNKNFKSIGELEEIFPRDFQAEPKIVKEINDPVVRAFTKNLVSIWPTLTRKVSYRVFEEPDTHSLIPVQHPFVIPGGRFKEYYYWDSYWIIKGLLLSDMVETARGMVQNIISIVERYGFVPNGGRVYYLNRSQPPVLTLMVYDYMKYTKDYEFVRQNIGALEKELKFWLTKRIVEIRKNGKIYILAHFDSSSDTPRPESYFEDIETCSNLPSDDEKYECYTDLKSGAESGWDFTSRWFFEKDGGLSDKIENIQTRRNIPVDLNSFLYKSFTVMYKFFMILGKPEQAKHYMDLSESWKEAIENVFWNEEDGTWYDYDIKTGQHRKFFFASNLTPLWAGAYNEDQRVERGKRSVDYLRKHGVLQLRGGIPASMIPTGQQWDYPNAWTPFQNLIIIGLHKSGHPEAIEVARDLAHKWINSNIKGFHENKAMFEKYNAQNSGQFGGGGEYHIQAGFGWSNGGILELINFYHRAKIRKSKGLTML